MFKVKVLTIGRSRETWLQEAIAEYEKRLRGKLTMEWIFAKSDEQLIRNVSQETFLILLDPKGSLFTSEEFSAKFLQLLTAQDSRLSFVIGGAEGIPLPIRQQKHLSWSLSSLTFTHQMTRLILIEQIYRALEIDKGSLYNK